jgi:hypothetical protein
MPEKNFLGHYGEYEIAKTRKDHVTIPARAIACLDYIHKLAGDKYKDRTVCTQIILQEMPTLNEKGAREVYEELKTASTPLEQ